MNVEDVMTKNPATCRPDTSLQDAARMMVEQDCGALPVVQGDGQKQAIGIITDRDITCRIVAAGMNPLEKRVSDAMTPSPRTIAASASLEECMDLMEESQVRRIIVEDDHGNICGIVAQADIAQSSAPEDAGDMVRSVSSDSASASALE